MNFLQATGGEDVVRGSWLLVYDVLGSVNDPLQGLFLSAAELPPYHAGMPYVRILSVEQR